MTREPAPVPSARQCATSLSPASTWPWLALLCVTLVMVGSLAFAATSIRLYQDDFIFLYEASRVQSPADLVAFAHASRDRFPRPVTTAFFWVAWHAWGLQRAPYHLASLGLHALAAMLLAVVIALSQRPQCDISWPRFTLAGGVAALFFVSAPCHAEVLCWPAAVEKEIQACLALACLACWLQADTAESRTWRVVAWLCLVASLLTEEWAVVLPVFLLAADRLDSTTAHSGTRNFLARHGPSWGAVAAMAGLALLGATRNPGLAFTVEASRHLDLVADVVSGVRETILGPGAATAMFAGAAGRSGSWVLAIAWLLLVAWAWRAERRLAFWLLWVPLAWVPYAAFVPNSPAVERYTYLPCLGVAAVAGLMVQTPSRRAVRVLLLAVVFAWTAWNAYSLESAVRRIAQARSGLQRELAEIPRCLARLGPGSTAWVYCPPLKAHFPSHAAGLVGELPPERLRDWYEALRRGRIEPGDVMLYYDESTGDWADLTRVVEASSLSTSLDRDRRVLADRTVLRWNLEASSSGQAWRFLAPVTGAPALLESPPIDLAPGDFYAVRVLVKAEVPVKPGASMSLAWRTTGEASPDPACTVSQALSPGSGLQEVTLFPATRMAFWTRGNLARLVLTPCSTPGSRIHVQQVELLEFPPRVRLSR